MGKSYVCQNNKEKTTTTRGNEKEKVERHRIPKDQLMLLTCYREVLIVYKVSQSSEISFFGFQYFISFYLVCVENGRCDRYI